MCNYRFNASVVFCTSVASYLIQCREISEYILQILGCYGQEYHWSCLLVCLDTFLVVLTSSVELCFRLISPVDCLCLYRLVDHKSCDLWVPRCGLCGPHFPKNVDFLVHIFLIWVTNLKMAAMLLGSPHFFYGESPKSTFLCGLLWWLHCFSPLVVHV